jgi:ABC-type Zn2+ transport system substrate-binding protein/surface adhesin
MHLKQACSYLMYYGNDFERFLSESLQFHEGGKLSLMDMHKIKYMAAVQQNSYQHQSSSNTDSLNQFGQHKNIEEEDDDEEDDLNNS